MCECCFYTKLGWLMGIYKHIHSPEITRSSHRRSKLGQDWRSSCMADLTVERRQYLRQLYWKTPRTNFYIGGQAYTYFGAMDTVRSTLIAWRMVARSGNPSPARTTIRNRAEPINEGS